jgi:LysR family cys regulon transcriptional activator
MDMRLEQLRFLCEVHDRGFNISKAAESLHISQPAVSTQIRMLEEELGVEILLRRSGRIVGLTSSGVGILSVARRIAKEVENLRDIRAEFANENKGRICIATTHINARYVLLEVVDRFRRQYPDVRLVIRQGNPSDIRELVLSGESDIGITSAPPDGLSGLETMPCYVLDRVVITPLDHPLLARGRLTLKDISAYPIITMDASFAGGAAVLRAFARKGIEPDIVMTATDAGVIKAYVERGMGITILPAIAFEPQRDCNLRAVPAAHLFEPTSTFICVHPSSHLPQYMHDFIEMLVPSNANARTHLNKKHAPRPDRRGTGRAHRRKPLAVA